MMIERKQLDKMSINGAILAAVKAFQYLSYFITSYLILFIFACICYSLRRLENEINKNILNLQKKKLDQLNESSCKPYTITKHLNGLYNLSYGLDVVAWMLKPRELWQLVNTLCILNILEGPKMTIWKRERNHFNYYVTNERKQPTFMLKR